MLGVLDRFSRFSALRGFPLPGDTHARPRSREPSRDIAVRVCHLAHLAPPRARRPRLHRPLLALATGSCGHEEERLISRRCNVGEIGVLLLVECRHIFREGEGLADPSN